ncbi:MAG: methylenetetrahydrofolate reductase [Chloroflexi bacterium]|nr:methylenetetrahydrofolate reductase [Chloroflexota bacterium]
MQCLDAVQIVADFSPPSGTDPTLLEDSRCLDADFISVNYSPGKSARVNSAFAAAWIKHNVGKEVTFTLSTRDMNRVAVQGLLLGANMMGLENVVVLKGDSFSERELAITRPVDDYVPTGLIRAIADMNRGTDYKGLILGNPTNFCIGATIDLGLDMERQVALTRRKVEEGTQFFLLQSLFSPERLTEFLERYEERSAEGFSALICCGVQIVVEDGVTFGNVPDWVTSAIRKGHSGEDIAVELASDYLEAGQRSLYLLPPVYRGGRRDYEACQRVIERVRRL